MSIIDLSDLLYSVPDLIDLFLSGFIFILLYNWLNNKKMEIGILTVWGLFSSHIIKAVCSCVHSVICVDVIFLDVAKTVIYVLVGIAGAVLFTWLKNRKVIQKLLYCINNKSVNSDIFDDIIDYDKQTMMQIYLKSSSTMYIGRFAFREEKGLDSWIVLADYSKYVNDVKIFNPNDHNIKSSVTINLNDVESIEIIYEDDSEVWKQMSEEKDNNKLCRKTKNKRKINKKK